MCIGIYIRCVAVIIVYMKYKEDASMKYHVMKCDTTTEEWSDYGTVSYEDLKLIVRGYHFKGLFYEKKNSNTIYAVEERR